MTNPNRDKTGRKTLLLGLVLALGASALFAYSAKASTTITGGSPQPIPEASTQPPTPTPTPEPEQAPPTVTVTETDAPAPAPPTVTVTEQPPAPAPSTEVYTPPPAPRSTSAPAPAPQPDPDLSDTEIRTEVSDAFGVVNTYWIDLFSTWKDPQGNPVSWRVPNLMNGNGFYDSAHGNPYDCGHDYDPGNASFCPYNDFLGGGVISWDMEFFREAHDDAAIYATVAHEVAHGAQARFWADGEGLATPNPDDSVAYEQQADCLAGATLAAAEKDGYLTIEPGDLQEISTFFLGMESGGDHGDAADRLTEFRWGYGGDIESCLYNQGVPPH